MMHQEQLPLDARERVAAIRAACARLRLSAPRRHNVQLLLEKIEAHGGRQGGITKRLLAEVMLRSIATVKRAIKDAESVGILVVVRHSGHEGDQANAYAIQWDTLKALARGMVPRPTRVPKTHDPPGVQIEPGWGQIDPPGVQIEPPLARSLIKQPPLGGCDIKLTSSSFLPSRQAQRARLPGAHEAATSDHGLAWQEVEEEFLDLGMGDARGLARRIRGVIDAGEAMAIIAFWKSQPGRWGLGALHWKLREARPGEDPSQRWPADSPEWIRERRRQSDRHAAIARREHELSHQTAAAVQQARLDQLEAEHGAALDRLTAAELRELAGQAFGDRTFYHAMLRRTGRESTILRPMLLEALAARDQVPTREVTDDAQVPR